MIVHLRSLVVILLFLVVNLYANPIKIDKESYITYQEFKKTQSNKKTINAPDDWYSISYQPPLIAKYQVNEFTELSISSFEGSIGDDCSNIQRWQRQLNLDPTPCDSINSFIDHQVIMDYPTKIITLSNNYQYLIIFWITIKDTHFFTKITSQKNIRASLFIPFIENQNWESL